MRTGLFFAALVAVGLAPLGARAEAGAPPPPAVPAPPLPAPKDAPPAAPPAPGPVPVPGVPSPKSAGPASLVPSLEAGLSYEARGDLAFLQHLGWRVVVDPTAKQASYLGGQPARRASLEAAKAAGDLVLTVPPDLSTDREALARWGAALPVIADGVDSRCAWQLRVQPAVERAAAELSAAAKREDYRFPKLLIVIDNPFVTLDPPEGLWVRQGDLWLPTAKPSESISAFWTKKSIAECFVAQTIASLAVQYELYGPQDFDEAFKREDLGLGWVKAYYDTPFGHSMDKEDEHDWRALLIHRTQAEEDAGQILGRLGPRAFAGLTGILMDPGGSGRGNENFIVVSVSDAACEQLARGGFAEVERLWRIALEEGARARGAFMSPTDIDEANARMRAAYAEPAMSGVRIYIHPYGVVTFAEMADKKRRKERTPVSANVYKGGREDAYFHRYRDAFLARWKRANPPGPAATDPSRPTTPPRAPEDPAPTPGGPSLPPPRRG